MTKLRAGWTPSIMEPVSGEVYALLQSRDPKMRGEVRAVTPMQDEAGVCIGYLIAHEVSQSQAVDLLWAALRCPATKQSTIRIYDAWEQFKPLPDGSAA